MEQKANEARINKDKKQVEADNAQRAEDELNRKRLKLEDDRRIAEKNSAAFRESTKSTEAPA